jgi:hypothetical protein
MLAGYADYYGWFCCLAMLSFKLSMVVVYAAYSAWLVTLCCLKGCTGYAGCLANTVVWLAMLNFCLCWLALYIGYAAWLDILEMLSGNLFWL